MLYLDILSCKRKRFYLIHQDGWTRSNRCGEKGPIPIVDMGGLRQVLQRIPVCNDGCSRFVHPSIAISVIPVPMSAYQIFQRRRADLVKCSFHFSCRYADSGVDKKLPVLA